MALPLFRMGPSLELIGTELLYTIIVIAISALIYRKTQEVYRLTKHSGVFHFRNVFLYFAIAYSFRLVLMFVKLSRELLSMSLPQEIHGISIMLVGYFSTLAILSLIMTLVARRLKRWESSTPYILHGIAIGLSLLAFFTFSPAVVLFVQTVFLFTFLLLFLLFRDSKGHRGFLSHNRITYLLLFVFWLVNMLAFTRRLLPQYVKIPLYLLSAVVYMSIYHRVHQRLSSHGKKKRSS
ncbi:MAG: hypothetical protein ABIC95_03015 [archaeon]